MYAIRCLLLLFVFPLTTHALTVYKTEQADGSLLLSDKPQKGMPHETLTLSENYAPHTKGKTLHVDALILNNPSKTATEENTATAQEIRQAEVAVRSAENQLKQVKAQQARKNHDCDLHTYRQSHTDKNICEKLTSTDEEIQLTSARNRLQSLRIAPTSQG